MLSEFLNILYISVRFGLIQRSTNFRRFRYGFNFEKVEPIPTLTSIEVLCGILKPNVWNQSVKQISGKIKELDDEIERDIILGGRSKLRKMWRDDVFCTLDIALFINKKLNNMNNRFCYEAVTKEKFLYRPLL